MASDVAPQAPVTDTHRAQSCINGTPKAELAALAPGRFHVIRRNGKVTGFEAHKISVAITKAFLAVEGGSAAASPRIHETVANITAQVVKALTRRMPGGGTAHIERRISKRSRIRWFVPERKPGFRSAATWVDAACSTA